MIIITPILSNSSIKTIIKYKLVLCLAYRKKIDLEKNQIKIFLLEHTHFGNANLKFHKNKIKKH